MKRTTSKGRFNIRFTAGPLAGKSFSLGPGDLLYVGKDRDCGIVIEGDPLISGRHACIHYSTQGKILFKDLSSEHGTKINGKRLRKTVKLRAGDRITIGQHSTFQGAYWNPLQPSRFTKIAMQKFSAIRHKSSWVLSDKNGRVRGPGPAAAGVAVVAVLASATYFLMQTYGRGAQEQTARLIARAGEMTGNQNDSNRSSTNPNSYFVWDEIVNISRRFGDAPPSVMDRAFVAEVEGWIEKFTKHDSHKVLLKRKEQYWPIIEAALRKSNLPVELGYVVWVESAFNAEAQSGVGAVGLWQFMPETAREYGLRVAPEQRIDERLDPVKSSMAAAAYFTMLLRMFGTDRYLLALASYNTGQNRIERHKIAVAVRRARRADFWHIHSELPQETIDYVPKVLAAIIVGRNPNRW